MTPSDVQVLYAYNRWANDRTLRAAAPVPDDQLRRDLGSSHRSLWDTLLHIAWGEWRWLGRWEGRSQGPGADPTTCADLAALRTRWGQVADAQRTLVELLSAADLERAMTYENPPGVRWTYSLGQMLQHVVNHSTYHRGQVTSLLRQLGFPAVPTDFLVYFDALAIAADRPEARA